VSDLAIRVRGLGKRYRIGAPAALTLREALSSAFSRRTPDSELWALKDVDLEVRRGEVVGIIGRNGAGKSTLLKILSRITEPTEGEAEVRGRVRALLEVGTGFHGDLTGRENVYFNGAILGMKRAEIDRKFDEIVAFAEVERFLDTPVKHYSSGMFMRLAFSVAAHLEPEILLVDEVLAVGDAGFQKKCLGKMDQVARGGRTVLFVSHNMGAVAALTRSALLLDRGRVVSRGETSAVLSEYLGSFPRRSQSAFPPEPSMRMQLRSVSVLDVSGRAASELDLRNPVTIQIVYQVRERASGVMVGCEIVSRSGVVLVATDDTDANPDLFGPREPGLYLATFDLPPHLLNSGEYSLNLGICVPNTEILDRREDAARFQLFDSGTFVARGGGGIRRNAELLLRIPWKCIRTGPDASVPSGGPR
jgi:lipopolysaccharide transport system ATP-binding protein